MKMSEYEFRIIRQVRKDMFKAIDRDGINKIYRQARVWNRFHFRYAEACTRQMYEYLNQKFKKTRLEALSAIGGAHNG